MPFQLDRVLAGQHEERLRQRPRVAQQRHRVLLHRFEQGGLGLGARAVDLVGQEDVGEHGAGLEGHLAPAARFPQDVRAEDVAGHQVRRELDAAELESEDLPQGLDHRRFSHAGQPFQQDVAAAEDARQHQAVQGAAAQEDLVHLREHPAGQGHGGRHFFRLQQGCQ